MTQDRVKFMVTQKVGDEYEEGMEILRELYAKASKTDERDGSTFVRACVSDLKCGGSDGFSGITANPLLGMFSDFLIAQGGTTVLTEVPRNVRCGNHPDEPLPHQGTVRADRTPD